MANVTCELVWIKDLLTELDFAPLCPMILYCDNQIIHIAENPVFHESTKHIEVNYHLVCQKIEERLFKFNMFHLIIS